MLLPCGLASDLYCPEAFAWFEDWLRVSIAIGTRLLTGGAITY